MRKNKRLSVNKKDSNTDIFNKTEKRATTYYTKVCTVNK